MNELQAKYESIGWTTDQVSRLVYAVAEQIHVSSCALRGSFNHVGTKGDEDVAVAILSGMFNSGYYMEVVPEWIGNSA